jgi:hypothetical protein
LVARRRDGALPLAVRAATADLVRVPALAAFLDFFSALDFELAGMSEPRMDC